MATKVEHVTTGKTFILLGTGFGSYKATRPSVFFGNWAPSEEEGSSPMAAVCNEKGEILWVDSADLKVITIDGVKPEQALMEQ